MRPAMTTREREPRAGAVSAAGHVIVDMAGLPTADLPAAQMYADRVHGCEVDLGVLGTRYGSPVRDRPDVSYTELEFEAATEAGPSPAGVPVGHRCRRHQHQLDVKGPLSA